MSSSSQKDNELLLVLITLPEQWTFVASAKLCHSIKVECFITQSRRFNLVKQTENEKLNLYKSKETCFICRVVQM